jgi:hypothetical protein
MSEITQEEALRLADTLVCQALKEAEARCTVLGQFINDCDRNGSQTSAWDRRTPRASCATRLSQGAQAQAQPDRGGARLPRGRVPGEGVTASPAEPDCTSGPATSAGSSAATAIRKLGITCSSHGQLRQQLPHPRLERRERRRDRPALILRRRVRGNRLHHRRPRDPQTRRDLRLRHTLRRKPADRGPVLQSDHSPIVERCSLFKRRHRPVFERCRHRLRRRFAMASPA